MPESLDIVLANDFATVGDRDVRVAQEVRCLAGAGYRVRLLHVGRDAFAARIAPHVQACVRAGLAEPVDPAEPVAAKLLLVHDPEGMSLRGDRLGRVSAERVVLVADTLPRGDIAAAERRLSAVLGPVAWAPANRRVRDALAASRLTGDILPEDWSAIALPAGPPAAPPTGRIGWVLMAGQEHAPPPDHAPDDDMPELLLLKDRPPERDDDGDEDDGQTTEADGSPVAFHHGGVAISRFLDRIGALGFFPPPDNLDVPDAIVVEAMAAGRAVVLPAFLRPHYGDGPAYAATPSEARVALRSLAADDDGLATAGEACRNAASERFAPEGRLRAVRDLIGEAGRPSAPPASGKGAERDGRPAGKRALFIAMPGDPLAMNPALAVARRLAPEVRPTFLVVGAGSELVEAAGFPALGLAPPRAVWRHPKRWMEWFAFELNLLLDGLGPDLAVLFEEGLAEAVAGACAPRGDCALAALRLGRSRPARGEDAWSLFDTVLEAGDLGVRDTSATDGLESVGVPPIVVFDEGDRLPRDRAATELGLDPSRPSALIRLGSGIPWRGEAAGEVLSALRERPDIQVIAHEPITGLFDGVDWPPGVRRLRHGDIARHIATFDMTVSGAGYDAFHDAMQGGAPAILVTGEGTRPEERRRATFADQADVALCVGEVNRLSAADAIRLALDEDARGELRTNVARLRLDNGAAEAAAALARLVGV